MKTSIWRSFVVACALVATFQAPASAQDFTFTAVSVPNSAGTQVRGFAPNGEIVGDYFDAKFHFHGFIISNKKVTTVDAPGATSTIVQTGNAAGYLVQAIDANGNTSGFFLDKTGKFNSIAVPGAASTFPTGINAAGTIVGRYFPSSGPAEEAAFILAKGKYSTVAFKNAFDTEFNGINDANVIAGSYRLKTSANFTGFTSLNSKLTRIMVPGSLQTNVQGINNAGEVVGYWQTSTRLTGFVFDGKTYSSVSPGTSSVWGWGIDSSGDVGGFYFNKSKELGFLGKPKASSIIIR